MNLSGKTAIITAGASGIGRVIAHRFVEQGEMREQAEKRGMTLEEWMPFFLHNISMHTMIDMKEIADVAVFLASDLAPHISGQSISVCGNFESYRGPKTAGD
ncbi:hypothetical protein MPL1032_70101 [Mesorhizobium plurifarium]|uniref:Short-chain dehydrogenase/reductase SDR n=1 Tax=Mesorhizobium plurifarium TaxID=69974 RepID=A0A0K2W6M4_MESPL|nr:hypothetical protein MPL1032_70101 [Mesorhizobium plurifarium]